MLSQSGRGAGHKILQYLNHKEDADLVILGPGSLYTSILPNLLIRDIRDALLKCDAYKIYISNVMTQPGETDDFTCWDHLRVLLEHTDPRLVDACFVNNQTIPVSMIAKYAEKGALPVEMDLDKIREKGYELVEGPILEVDGRVRHNPEELARMIFDHYFKMAKMAKV